MSKIIIAADPLGFELKNKIKEHLISRGYEVEDVCPDAPVDYYIAGGKVGEAVSTGKADLGMAFCATGMGPSIVANKFKRVYASVIESDFTSERCKVVNNANVLTMGQQVLTPEKAVIAIDKWLDAKFTKGCGFDDLGDFLTDSLQKIKEIEDKNMK